ncbi:MAG TPA: hypothetical protein VI424_14230, partial [Terriglobales bacterium]
CAGVAGLKRSYAKPTLPQAKRRHPLLKQEITKIRVVEPQLARSFAEGVRISNVLGSRLDQSPSVLHELVKWR